MHHQHHIINTPPPPPPPASSWTSFDNWLFLKALVSVPEGIAGRWQLIAAGVPGKTAEDVRAHYAALEHEVNEIESGRVPLPDYIDDDDEFDDKKESPPVRKKGFPWSKEEHRRFLEGLQIYGKGDWRSISRNIVITRTATQVASHAQKYFIRQASASQRKEKKRSSIHDMTIADITKAEQLPLSLPSSSSSPSPPPSSSRMGRARP